MPSSTFFCIDAHTCGNPVRVVAGGAPFLQGENIMEKRLHFLEEYDWIRTGLMFEPRGHDMMSGSILYPPHNPAHDAAVLFIETSGCLPMCGHGTIGTVTIAIEEGLVQPKTPGKLVLETPAGIITAEYTRSGKKVSSVKLINIPSFLAVEKLRINCAPLGELEVDVAYGGNFYAIIDIQDHFSGIDDYTTGELIAWSRDCRRQINEQRNFVHPEDARIRGVSHLLWAGKPLSATATARGAVFYGNKAIDRSPCGTGTSARMAQWHAQGRLQPGELFIHESIIGSQFTGRIEKETVAGECKAIVPSIEGWAVVYGHNTIKIDDEDPYAHGFQVI